MEGCRWLFMIYFLLLVQLSYEATSSQISGGKHMKRAIFGWGRGPGLFGMVRQFIRETVTDTNKAVRNITDIINSEFPPSSQFQNVTGNNTSSVSGAMRLTLPEVNSILGRNYRSLVRLFNTEFRSALSDSNKNIQMYRVELKDAVRPYFMSGAYSTTTTARSTSSRRRRR